MNRPIVAAMRHALVISTLVLVSCQTYDFQRVDPLFYRRITNPAKVKGVRPDVLVLLDRSGSMGFPINPLDTTACPANCGDGTAACPASCPTRISELRSAMPVFFGAAKDQARFGLALFPRGEGAMNQCVPTNTSLVIEPLPPDGAETTDNVPSTPTVQLYAASAEGFQELYRLVGEKVYVRGKLSGLKTYQQKAPVLMEVLEIATR